MADKGANEALEKLNRGIEESKKMVQQQTLKLAQEFFGDSVEEMKGRIGESRAALEDLPDRIPGGDDEAFQMLFQELMDNYSAVEKALDEARENVSNLDTESLVRQGEVEATDAARREAQEQGVDLTEIEGTGTDGRVTVDDVKSAAEQVGEGAAEEAQKASDAAKRKAEELGVDLSEVEGTGVGGAITVRDVTSLAEDTTEAVADTADQAAEGADGAVGQATDAVSGTAEENGSGEPRATNAAQRKAEELGVDLSEVKGSGAGGLITIKDVMK